MPSLAKVVVLASLVAVGFAGPADSGRCSGAKLVSNTTIHAGGHDILHTTHSCHSKTVNRRQSITSVCGASCTVACNDVSGILPPISKDCQTIENAIVILQGTMSPTFDVQPNHLESLTFGTCSYFFENTGPVALESCWADMATWGHADGAACFPPVHPFFPEGLCTSSDGTWAIGATHS